MEKRDLGKLGKCEICENWDFCNLQKLGILIIINLENYIKKFMISISKTQNYIIFQESSLTEDRVLVSTRSAISNLCFPNQA